MKNNTIPTLEESVRKALDDIGVKRLEDGTYIDDIPADYRDAMSVDQAARICNSEYPYECFLQVLYDDYEDVECWLWKSLVAAVMQKLRKEETDAEKDDDDIKEKVHNILYDIVRFDMPWEHYLRQEFNVTIIVDAGNEEKDSDDRNTVLWLSPEAEDTILWLVQQQGYTQQQFEDALRKADEDTGDDPVFLKSCREEIDNCETTAATVTFLVRMTLRELIELNTLINLRNDKNVMTQDYGVLTLSSETMTGLFDTWSGAGSSFDIELDKDVQIPIRLISSAIPDKAMKPGVGTVYGLLEACWDTNIISITPPADDDTEDDTDNDPE